MKKISYALQTIVFVSLLPFVWIIYLIVDNYKDGEAPVFESDSDTKYSYWSNPISQAQKN